MLTVELVVITFTSVMIVTIYLLIAAAAIVSRLRERDAERSFKMLLWLLPPVLAIIGIGSTLRYQKFGNITITLITIAIAVLYWLAYLHRNTRQAHSSESAL
jgi:amino acid transporter